MFYIRVKWNSKYYWFTCRQDERNNKIIRVDLITNALFAEAIPPQSVENIRQYVEQRWPGVIAEPIEASTRKLIPENMLKTLNLA